MLSCSDNGRILPAGVLYYSASVADVNSSAPRSVEEGLRAAEKSITRKGVLTDDEDVLRAMECGLDGKYIAVTIKDDAPKAKNKSITLAEQGFFDELKEHTESLITAIARDMYEGKIEAQPLEHKGKVKCRWCEMRAICRRYDIDGIEEDEQEGGEDQ